MVWAALRHLPARAPRLRDRGYRPPITERPAPIHDESESASHHRPRLMKPRPQRQLSLPCVATRGRICASRLRQRVQRWKAGRCDGKQRFASRSFATARSDSTFNVEACMLPHFAPSLSDPAPGTRLPCDNCAVLARVAQFADCAARPHRCAGAADQVVVGEAKSKRSSNRFSGKFAPIADDQAAMM